LSSIDFSLCPIDVNFNSQTQTKVYATSEAIAALNIRLSQAEAAYQQCWIVPADLDSYGPGA